MIQPQRGERKSPNARYLIGHARTDASRFTLWLHHSRGSYQRGTWQRARFGFWI